jgi:SAM-dependent methyltransferase
LDLRPVDSGRLERARRLALRGLLNYQPYIFDDTLAVGSGLSIAAGHRHDVPSIYCPNIEKGEASPDFIAREVARSEQHAVFFDANERMRRFYDGIIDQTVKFLGSVNGMSVLDVGCNAGYFSISFARRGASRVLGLDRVDYAETIALLNSLCKTSTQFRLWSYDGKIDAEERFDLVISIAMLVHLSDPLQHLAWLGASARKALLVFTPCHDDDEYSIKFHTVNRYYHDRFPYCFDVSTLSKKLLRLSLEQMGFTRIIDLKIVENSMPAHWANVHLGLLGIRESDAAVGSVIRAVRP